MTQTCSRSRDFFSLSLTSSVTFLRFGHDFSFKLPVVSTDYLSCETWTVARSLVILSLFRQDAFSDYAMLFLSFRGSTLNTRSPSLSVPRRLFIKFRRLQTPIQGGVEPLVLSFLPRFSQQQWLPVDIVLVRMKILVWAWRAHGV